ncbi:hypothetical protein BH09PLA1_BH09PLA1_03190 [soil metagenome]
MAYRTLRFPARTVSNIFSSCSSRMLATATIAALRRRRRKLIAPVTVAALFAVFAPAALAIDRHFVSLNGPWASFPNWNPSGVPQPADNAIVDFFNGGPGRATVSIDVGAVTSATIANGDTVAFTNGGTLLCGSGGINVGYFNTAGTLSIINPNPINFFQAGMTVTGEVHVGRLSGSGTISQNDGTVTLVSGLYVGSSGNSGSPFGSTGTYNFGGGTFRGTSVSIAVFTRSAGSLNVSGGTFTSQSMTIGNQGDGFVRQTGGIVNISQNVLMGSANTSSNYTLNGGSFRTDFLQLGSGMGTALFSYNGGSFFVDTLDFERNTAALRVSPGANKVVQLGNILEMGDNHFPVKGTVDLSDNRMTLPYFQFNYDEVRRDLRSAYNNGLWNGLGLTSSIAAASLTHSTALGYGYNGGFLLVKYTYYGDADLNGIVNFDDYSRIDNGYNNGGSDWSHGDFNYDGVVNFDDYALIDLAFNTQNGTLRGAMSYLDGGDRSDADINEPALRLIREHFRQFGDAYASSFLHAVPEPGSGLLALGVAAALPGAFRSRRRSK